MQVAMQWDDNGIIQLGCIWGYSLAIQHSYGFLMAYFVRWFTDHDLSILIAMLNNQSVCSKGVAWSKKTVLITVWLNVSPLHSALEVRTGRTSLDLPGLISSAFEVSFWSTLIPKRSLRRPGKASAVWEATMAPCVFWSPRSLSWEPSISEMLADLLCKWKSHAGNLAAVGVVLVLRYHQVRLG